MRLQKRIFVLLICGILSALPSLCDTVQGRDFRFSALSVADGLSQNTVLSIVQDDMGNVWFATLGGLDKYDGYSFTNYHNDPADTTSLAHNMVRVVYKDSKGRIWAGTNEGVSLYDREGDCFRNCAVSGGYVTGIAEIGDNLVMVGSENGLSVLDVSKGGFADGVIPEYMSSVSVSSLSRSGNTVYIGTSGSGLYTYSLESGEFSRITQLSTRRSILAVNVSGGNSLWVATEGDGLFRMDMTNGKILQWKHSPIAGQGLCSNYVRSLVSDSEGRIWVGTYSGLNIIDGDTVLTVLSDPFQSGSISHNSVRSLYVDNQNGVWLGTYFGGVNYWNPYRNRFRNIRRTKDEGSLRDNIVSCITGDAKGNIWMGTNSGGIELLPAGSKVFRHYSLENSGLQTGGEYNDVKAILVDAEKGVVYAGAHAGGLNILDGRTGRSVYSSYSDRSSPQSVYSIIRADEDNLWIGSLRGLWLFNTAARSFRKMEVNAPAMIKALVRDRSGRLWVGGDDGLRVYSLEGLSLKEDFIPELPSSGAIQYVQCFFESGSNSLWIGTRNGVIRYDSVKHTTRLFTEADGLPNNVINGIEEDSLGRLWISTDKGLSCFNPYSEIFRNYSLNDGLQSSQFNNGAHFRTEDGVMYFGGINGVTSFVPENLEDNPFTPQPQITALTVLNNRVRPGDKTGILQKDISLTQSIVLKHKYNYFSLDYSVPDFVSSHHNTFSYYLEGFDTQWNSTSSARTVNYSNLPKGRYRFLLKAANSDGRWNETPTVLEIRVLPVWYQSTLAILAFIFVLLAIAVFVVRFLLERKSMENRLVLEKRDSRHKEEMNQMKMSFFINISHELRSPLTLIINPLQDMIRNASDLRMRKQLKYVERNAQRMMHIVNQLMDYRRADLGVFKLSVRQEDVERLVRECWSLYENLAKSKKLRYTFESSIGAKKMYADAHYLDLILNNLLSNALKFTAEGSVSVELAQEGGDLVLRVRDTGTGIPAAEQEKVFDRFYQLSDKYPGSGIGLSLVRRLAELHHGEVRLESEEGKGSCFSVIFPQNVSVYSDDEFSSNADAGRHTVNTTDMYAMEAQSFQEETQADTMYAKRGRILVVDDNEEISTYIYKGLIKFFDVITASDGNEALEKLTSDVDLIITDMVMPKMDGMKLCAAVKQNRDTNHIPVIVLSAKTDVADVEEAMKCGADDYVFKPFSMKALASKVQNIMKTRARLHDKVSKTLDVEPEKVTFNAVDEDFLRRATAIIERNMDNVGFTTDVFAKELNMSRSNLHLRMKTITGESALEFIHRVRFKEACRLLEEGKLSVAEISDKVGFSTASYFSTCFKKYMGCIPSEYNKKSL